MDRFKFRVWHKFQKEMFEVYQIDFKRGLLYCESKEGTTHTFGFIDCELMQCTGLKDKNGVLIFEGDILDIKIDENVKVFWWNGLWLVKGGWLSGDDLSNYIEDAEIIGNIHDE